MGRAPFQVLVILFRRTACRDVEYAVFLRSDDGAWQGIAGGGEDDETALEAARRETFEEGGIPPRTPLYLMKMSDYVPVTSFAARDEWPVDTYVVRQHFSACDASGLSVSLSNEHSEVRWTTYEEAS